MANDTSITRYLPDGRPYLNIDTAKTLTGADNGVIQNIIADGIVITLPSTAAGFNFTVRNGGVPVTGGPVGTGSNKSVLVAVSPAAADALAGYAFTATVNKDALNTKATSKVGDELTVVASGTTGVTAWSMTGMKGVWAREA